MTAALLLIAALNAVVFAALEQPPTGACNDNLGGHGQDTSCKTSNSQLTSSKVDDSLLLQNIRAVRMLAHREAVLAQFAEHWLWIVDEDVVPKGDKVACNRLPREILPILKKAGVEKGKQYCSTSESDWKVPSARDVDFYIRFVEAPCTVANVKLKPHVIASFIFHSAEKGFADIDAYRNFNWDALARFEEVHAADLQGMQQVCHDLRDSEDSANLFQMQETLKQSDAVTHMRWWSAPVEHPLARSVGHTHSLIEVEAAGKSYVLEVLPGSLGVRAGATIATKPIEGNVHAEASQSQLRPSLTVSDVLDSLREHEKGTYDLLDNNCHAMTQKTFRWAAPGAVVPESPNSNWEKLFSKLNSVSPASFQTLLEMSGASRTMCMGGYYDRYPVNASPNVAEQTRYD